MIKITGLYVKKKIPEISQINLHIEDGESYVLLSSGERALNLLLDIGAGVETNYRGTVEINGIDARTQPDILQRHLSILTCGRQWPRDMKTGHLLTYFKNSHHIPEEDFQEIYIKLDMANLAPKRLGQLEDVEWRRILLTLSQLKKNNNYMLHDFARGMPLDFNLELKKSILHMKEQGNAILYLTDDVFIAPELGDRVGLMKKGKLLLELKGDKMKKMSLNELHFQFLAER